MNDHQQFSDEQFMHLFSTCKLPPDLFSHEAHLRLAWLYVTNIGLELAERKVTTQLKAYVKSLGAEEKYNETLTVAAIKAVGHFVNRSTAVEFPAFIKEFPRLNHNFKELMSAHYSFNIYDSSIAKREYQEPDLLAF